MKVIADLSLVPIGVGVSLSKYVAAAHKELEAAGLSCHLHAYGTNVEGEYDQVFAALKRCLERIHEMGAPRVTCTIKPYSCTRKAFLSSVLTKKPAFKRWSVNIQPNR